MLREEIEEIEDCFWVLSEMGCFTLEEIEDALSQEFELPRRVIDKIVEVILNV